MTAASLPSDHSATASPWWWTWLSQIRLGAGAIGQTNRWSVQGLQIEPGRPTTHAAGPATAAQPTQQGGGEATQQDETVVLAFEQAQAASLSLVVAGCPISIGRVTLHQGRLEFMAGPEGARLVSAKVESAAVSGLMVSAPWQWVAALETRRASGQGAVGAAPASGAGGVPWRLAPLASLEGTIRAHIRDAELLFDAEVTIPIRRGELDFNKATVEHIGPDSRMGISRMGVYVDAPNGRSYLVQFGTPPVSGVRYEERGRLLSALVADRGHVSLQPFIEAVLHQWGVGAGAGGGLTAQARNLLQRTALEGELKLGTGMVEAPGVKAELLTGDGGAATLGLRSEAVGRELSATLSALHLGQVALASRLGVMTMRKADGGVRVRLGTGDQGLRLELEIDDWQGEGLELDTRAAAGP